MRRGGLITKAAAWRKSWCQQCLPSTPRPVEKQSQTRTRKKNSGPAAIGSPYTSAPLRLQSATTLDAILDMTCTYVLHENTMKNIRKKTHNVNWRIHTFRGRRFEERNKSKKTSTYLSAIVMARFVASASTVSGRDSK